MVSKAWIVFSVSKQGPCFTAIEEDGGDKRLVEVNPAFEADGGVWGVQIEVAPSTSGGSIPQDEQEY